MNSITKSNFISLGILLGLSFALISVTNHYILTINFFDNSDEFLAGNPAQENEVYESLQKYIYFSTAVYSLIKICVVALIIYTALYLADHPIKINQAIMVVISAEFTFLTPAVIKIFWFKYEYPHGTLSDWHKVYILSALSLFDGVSADWYYPLQTINVFEVAYWFVLAYGIQRITTLNFDQALKIIVLSYLPALVIWMAVIVFCTVMLFPGNA